MARHRPPSQRQLKAGEVIRRVLVDILAREPLRDPDLAGVSITITEVRAAPDLKTAQVFAAPLSRSGAGQAKIDTVKVIAALNRSSRFLRGRLGREMVMKSTPRLKFIADNSFDQASEMDKLLSQPAVLRDLDR